MSIKPSAINVLEESKRVLSAIEQAFLGVDSCQAALKVIPALQLVENPHIVEQILDISANSSTEDQICQEILLSLISYPVLRVREITFSALASKLKDDTSTEKILRMLMKDKILRHILVFDCNSAEVKLQQKLT